METKKDARLWSTALIVLFCAFIGVMGALYMILPKRDFSEKEKRSLAALPEFTLRSVTGGTAEARFEEWMSDHVPGREGWVSLNAHYELLCGRNGLSGVLLGRSSRLYAAPAALDEAALRRRCEKIREFARATGLPATVLLVPESGFMNQGDLPRPHAEYKDGEAAALAREALGEVPLIWMEERYADAAAPTLYYRTDHHYTSRGAFLAFSAYAESLGLAAPAEAEYAVETAEGFYGSMYARAGVWEIPPEPVEIWRHPAQEGAMVRFEDGREADSLFFPEHLEEMDKYPVFLDGNHALVDIDTGRAEGETLLVVRDSFGHCFAPFAATAFKRVVLVDLRYYHQPVGELAAGIGADRLLLLYGMDTFLTDLNLAWLR